MPKSKIILVIGVFVALLPFLGFPQSWESFFEAASGISIVLLSVLISIDRRLSLKARVQKRQARKRALSTDEAPEIPYGRRAADVEKARVIRVGRRATDTVIKPIPNIPQNQDTTSTDQFS
jgi:hypothetical protein